MRPCDASHLETCSLGWSTGVATYNSASTQLTSSSIAYDKGGNVVSTVDPRSTTKTFSYDATSRLTADTQPISSSDSVTTSFGYDLAGHQTRFTDGRGNPFLATYNTRGLPESQIEPATTAYPNLTDRTFTTAYERPTPGRLLGRHSR